MTSCRLARLTVAVALLALPLFSGVSKAAADNAGDVLATVNSIRAGHGAAPLGVDPTLTALALQWSAHMASSGALAEPSLSQIPAGWTAVASNVAFATTVPNFFSVSWNDAAHLRNIELPAFNLTGIGVVIDARGVLWATEFFEALAGPRPPQPGTTVSPRITAAPKVPTTVASRPGRPAPAAGSPTTANPTTTNAATADQSTTVPTGGNPTTEGAGPASTLVPPPPGNRPASALHVTQASAKSGDGLLIPGVAVGLLAAVLAFLTIRFGRGRRTSAT